MIETERIAFLLFLILSGLRTTNSPQFSMDSV